VARPGEQPHQVLAESLLVRGGSALGTAAPLAAGSFVWPK
jgi:hypothetical protein